MNEPWFEPWMGGLLGGAFGILGGIYGTVVGMCAPRGLARNAVMGFHFACLAASLAALALGVIAYSSGQPYGVWYAFSLTGLLGTVLFGIFTPLIRLRYRQAEERKMRALDLG